MRLYFTPQDKIQINSVFFFNVILQVVFFKFYKQRKSLILLN